MIIICNLCSGNLFKATISREGIKNSEHEKKKRKKKKKNCERLEREVGGGGGK